MYKILIEDIFKVNNEIIYCVKFNFDYSPKPGHVIKISDCEFRISRVAVWAFPKQQMIRNHDNNKWDIMLIKLGIQNLTLEKNKEYPLEIPTEKIFNN